MTTRTLKEEISQLKRQLSDKSGLGWVSKSEAEKQQVVNKAASDLGFDRHLKIPVSWQEYLHMKPFVAWWEEDD